MSHSSVGIPSQKFQTDINNLYSLTLQEDDLKQKLKQLSSQISRTKTEVIQQIMQNNMQKRNFVIGSKTMHYKRDKKIDAITQRLLRDSLARYFEGHPDQAEALYEFIVSSRKSQYVDTLQIANRKTDKV